MMPWCVQAGRQQFCARASQHQRGLCGCEPRMSKYQKKKNHISCRLLKWLQEAAFLGCNPHPPPYPPTHPTPAGAFDKRVVHQFTGRVAVLQLLSFTLTSFFSPPRFLLSPRPQPLALLLFLFLLCRDPSAALMKRQVHCDSVLACRCDEMERRWERSRAVD